MFLSWLTREVKNADSSVTPTVPEPEETMGFESGVMECVGKVRGGGEGGGERQVEV